MFGNKKYTLKFYKAYRHVDSRSYREVTNACLLSSLLELQERYDFQIISAELRDCFGESSITIKCKKEDKNKIFTEYCIKLDKYIDRILF